MWLSKPLTEANCGLQEMLDLGRDWAEQPVRSLAPEAAHTILHTSGTTGLPKGYWGGSVLRW